jgi:sugar phosphate isomerase/epimerase
MHVATSTAILHPGTLKNATFGIKEIPRIVKTAGFDSLDWSLWEFCLPDKTKFDGPLTEPDWEKTIQSLREANEAAGIPCRQTHCVSVNTDMYQKLDHDQLRNLEKRCLLASSILGAEWMVIHPFSIIDNNRQASIRFFSEYLKPLQEDAHRYKVGIAIENMISRSTDTNRFCASAEELMELVDSIQDPLVGCCWDTGHANISKQDQYHSLNMLGPRIKALHINDNNGTDLDLHLLPFEGNIDWESVMKALFEIGFQYDFTFEHALNPIPAQVVPQQLHYMRCLGEAMIIHFI